MYVYISYIYLITAYWCSSLVTESVTNQHSQHLYEQCLVLRKIFLCAFVYRCSGYRKSTKISRTLESNFTFMWPCIVIWRSCDRASWYDVHVTVHRVKFLIIKPTRCTNFSNLFLKWNSTCFRQFLCPSSGVFFYCTHSNGIWYTGLLTACELSANLYDTYDTYHCCVYSEKLLMMDSSSVSKPVWHIPLLCVQWKTPDDGQRNCPKHVEFHSMNQFQKLMHLVGFIIRNLTRCTVTWTSYHDARSHERYITMHGHMNVSFKNKLRCLRAKSWKKYVNTSKMK
jgi:hypothetical protein